MGPIAAGFGGLISIVPLLTSICTPVISLSQLAFAMPHAVIELSVSNTTVKRLMRPPPFSLAGIPSPHVRSPGNGSGGHVALIHLANSMMKCHTRQLVADHGPCALYCSPTSYDRRTDLPAVTACRCFAFGRSRTCRPQPRFHCSIAAACRLLSGVQPVAHGRSPIVRLAVSRFAARARGRRVAHAEHQVLPIAATAPPAKRDGCLQLVRPAFAFK